jgi:single-strand DNA-binding protein
MGGGVGGGYMADDRSGGGYDSGPSYGGGMGGGAPSPSNDLDDEIPF